jgi:hypothetical protein
MEPFVRGHRRPLEGCRAGEAQCRKVQIKPQGECLGHHEGAHAFANQVRSIGKRPSQSRRRPFTI